MVHRHKRITNKEHAIHIYTFIHIRPHVICTLTRNSKANKHLLGVSFAKAQASMHPMQIETSWLFEGESEGRNEGRGDIEGLGQLCF